jgi:hypothetical protein
VTTFFSVKLTLLPLAVFIALVAGGWPMLACLVALTISFIVAFWRRLGSGKIRNLEWTVVAIFGALTVAVLLLPDVFKPHVAPLAFVALAAYATATVLLRRPWTMEFSRAAYLESANTPVFMRINMILSTLWAVLFLLIAVDFAFHGGFIAKSAIVGIGAAASVYGPNLLRRYVSG